MAEYIEREAAIGALRRRLGPNTSPAQKNMLQLAAIDIRSIKAADVAPVRPELRRSVKELHKQYERAINNPAVRNPLAWALYRTWVMMEGEANEK